MKIWQTVVAVVIVTCIEIIIGAAGYMLMFNVVFPVQGFGIGKAVLAAIATMLVIGPLNAKIKLKKE